MNNYANGHPTAVKMITLLSFGNGITHVLSCQISRFTLLNRRNCQRSISCIGLLLHSYPQATTTGANGPFCSNIVEKLKNWSTLLDTIQRFYLVSRSSFSLSI